VRQERGGGAERMQRLNRWILRGRAVKRVKTARIGEEPECRLCRARVAKKIGEGGRFESEGGKESRVEHNNYEVSSSSQQHAKVPQWNRSNFVPVKPPPILQHQH
jgi:hypothetical protein